jgi:hypothetical protein
LYDRKLLGEHRRYEHPDNSALASPSSEDEAGGSVNLSSTPDSDACYESSKKQYDGESRNTNTKQNQNHDIVTGSRGEILWDDHDVGSRDSPPPILASNQLAFERLNGCYNHNGQIKQAYGPRPEMMPLINLALTDEPVAISMNQFCQESAHRRPGRQAMPRELRGSQDFRGVAVNDGPHPQRSEMMWPHNHDAKINSYQDGGYSMCQENIPIDHTHAGTGRELPEYRLQ